MHQKNIKKAIKSLRNGHLLLVGTDTVPGIAVSPLHPQAVQEVYRLKGRKFNNPLVWMVSDFHLLSDILEVPPYAEVLIRNHWPGALTLIFRVRRKSHSFSLGLFDQQTDSLGVRIPAGDSYLIALLKQLAEPLAVTSVNRSGDQALTEWDRIIEEFGDVLDFSLYKDREKISFEGDAIPSTLVDVRSTQPQTIRQGRIQID